MKRAGPKRDDLDRAVCAWWVRRCRAAARCGCEGTQPSLSLPVSAADLPALALCSAGAFVFLRRDGFGSLCQVSFSFLENCGGSSQLVLLESQLQSCQVPPRIKLVFGCVCFSGAFCLVGLGFLNQCFNLQHTLLEHLHTLVQLLWLNAE